MGRLILTMHVSADGYIATPEKQLWPGFGWPPVVQGRLNSLYRDAGAVVYGRGVYEAVVPWWLAVARGAAPDGADVGVEGREFARMLAALPRYVVSRTLPEPEDGTPVIRHNAVQRIADLVAEHSGDVILLAGPELVSELLRAGLLNEITLMVGTVLVGAGQPLLDRLDQQVHLDLLEAEACLPTTTWLRYRVA